MASVKPRSDEKFNHYLELYCDPLSKDEEFEVDNQALQEAADALPEETGFTYDELWEQVEAIREEDEPPMPTWAWVASFYGTKAAKAVTENKGLRVRVLGFTYVFADKLIKLHRERKLIYGTWMVAPFVIAGRDRPRLYRLRDPANTPAEVLKALGLQDADPSDSPETQALNLADLLKLLDQTSAPGGGVADAIRAELPQHIWAFSQMPAQTVDRAARGAHGWSFPLDDVPTFADANNKHAVTYQADGLTLEALRDGVMQLNPRTADVWRLCTAKILESWREGEREPPRVWLDARELCDTMGFKKHHKGGHRPENVAIAARALVDLERFYITIPYGTKQYPEDVKTGKRKATTLEGRRRDRVLAVLSKEEVKELFEAEWLPLRWLVTPGEWIKAYPREQFAPLFRALVELPGAYTPDLWAKAIGTELVWQYRQDEGRVQIQRVETMLRQAGVLEEARKDHRKGRVRDNFEKALDKLKACGVCAGWEYNGSDFDKVEATTRGWFDIWLQARVVVTPPPEVTKALGNIAKTKKGHRRSERRRG